VASELRKEGSLMTKGNSIMRTAARRKNTSVIVRVVSSVLALMMFGFVTASVAGVCNAGHLTGWVSETNNWFIGTNWTLGVPHSIDTARVDNAGTAVISSGCAKARVLQIGFSDEGTGAVMLHSGAGLCVGAAEYIGLDGYGQFVQMGGTHSLSYGTLILGDHPNAQGDYFLNDGQLSVKKRVVVANEGAGTFLQSGGKHAVTCGDLVIAAMPDSSGSYFLDGGSMRIAGNLIVGQGGYAAYEQTAGTNIVFRTLRLGRQSGSEGDYVLDGGSLLAGSEVIGDGGIGNFEQTDGGHIICGDLVIARLGTNSIGNYELNDGLLYVGRNETIGVKGGATHYQYGGMHAVACALSVGGVAGSSGVLETEGGILKARTLRVGVGAGGGFLGIYGSAADVKISDSCILGKNSEVSVLDGAIHMTNNIAAFMNWSTNELALVGLADLEVIFEGGIQSDGGPRYRPNPQPKWATYEVSGENLGNTMPEGYMKNFLLRKLTVGGVHPARVRLVERCDNGNRTSGNREALYVHDVTVSAGSTLDLAGLNVYADGTVEIQGTVIGGVIQPCYFVEP